MLTGVVLALSTPATAAPTPPSFGVQNNSNVRPGGPPVEIDDCTAGTTNGLLINRSNGSFRVVFTNEGNTPADLIRFQLAYGSERIFVRDVGNYSPGITITHVFKRRGGNVISSPLFKPAPFSCSVVAVHFVDGSEWTPPGTSIAPTIAMPNGNGYIAVQLAQTPDGATIKFAFPGGPAQKAGLTQGDIIAAIDGQRIATLDEALTMLAGSSVGTVLQITISRSGFVLTIPVTVGQRPPQGA